MVKKNKREKSSGNWFKRSGKLSYTRTILVLGLIGLAFFGGLSLFSGFTIGHEAWQVQVGSGGAKVNGYEKIIGDTFDTTNLPPQISSLSGTSISIDSDRTALNDKTKDGKLPEVSMTETQAWHSDINGARTPPSTAAVIYKNNEFGDGLYWELHYFTFEVRLQTVSSLCNDHVHLGLGGLGAEMSTYESWDRSASSADYYLAIITKPQIVEGFNAGDFKSQFSDAKVLNVVGGVTDPLMFAKYGENGESMRQLDAPWHYTATYAKDAGLTPSNTITGDNGEITYIIALGAVLESGIAYTYGYAGDIEGIADVINVYITYRVLFSLLVSEPAILPDRGTQVMGDPVDKGASTHSFWDEFVAWFAGIGGGLGALVIIVIGIIVLILVIKLVGAFRGRTVHVKSENGSTRRRSRGDLSELGTGSIGAFGKSGGKTGIAAYGGARGSPLIVKEMQHKRK